MEKTENKTLPKFEDLQWIEDGSPYMVAKHLRENYAQPRENEPTKPRLNSAHTTAEAKQYVIQLEAYEKEMAEYKKNEKKRREHNAKIEALMEMYVKQSAGLHKVPEQYRDKVYNKAYQDGHSSGWGEIHSHLCDLVQIFE